MIKSWHRRGVDAVGPTYLVDKSALARIARPEVERRLAPLLLAGELGQCGVLHLEMLFSARNHSDLIKIRADLAALPAVEILQSDFDRAAEVLELLSRKGQHRTAGIPDLLTAAVAERTALRLLHYDKDFDAIAGVTGQAAEWVVRRGSVP